MATFTITTTAEEDLGIAAYVRSVNADRAAREQTPLTAREVISERFREVLASYYEMAVRETVAAKLTLEERQLLGLRT